MDFSSIKEWTISEGAVAKVANESGAVIWQKEEPVTLGYFYVENADTANANVLSIRLSGTNNLSQIQYCTDGNNWLEFADLTQSVLQVSIPVGGKCYLRGVNGGFNTETNYHRITTSYKSKIGGSLFSLVDYTKMDSYTTMSKYMFAYLFESSTNIIDASALDFSGITTIGEGSCYYMFEGATGLINPPNFNDVTSVGYYGLKSAFNGCSNMVKMPTLTNVASAGYQAFYEAFRGCKKLNDVGYMNISGYSGRMTFERMFYGCTSLEKGLELPKYNNMAKEDFYYMYCNCTALKVGTDLSKVSSSDGYGNCGGMYYGCTSLETIYTPIVTTWSGFNSWVTNAGTSVEGDKIMYAPNETVAALIPSGNNGYGNYTVKVIE